jgi:GTP-binding protein Era
LLLVDTPGIFKPRRRLDRAMVQAAWEGATGADIVVLVVDARAGLTEEVEALLDRIKQREEPRMLALNKVDVAPKERLLKLAAVANERVPFAETFMISAKTGDGVADVKATLAAAMPQEPWHFPADQVSDVTTRLLAAEITREQIFRQLHEELPYASAVETEKWEERRDGSVAIHQQVLVERDSQKGIVLGKGGAQIKKIGAAARTELEEQLGRRVHLFLHVKVKSDWADDRAVFRDMGLDWVE